MTVAATADQERRVLAMSVGGVVLVITALQFLSAAPGG